MPEGPEIRREADAIAGAILHRPATELFFAFEHLKSYEKKLLGEEVVAVTTKGKAMLIGFESQLTIYSHNQLYGRWFVRPAYSFPQTNRQLRLAIHNTKKSALLYSASEIEVLNPEELKIHPFLSRLGPDLLDATTTVPQIIERFVDRKFYRRGLASLLLDQGFLCGLGNYLRSEVLFVAKVHPAMRPIDCDSEQISQLATAAIAVTRQSYETGGITNDLQLAAQLKAQGYKRHEYRHYVFNREGKPCFVCGTSILKEILGGRRCYYCPNCQQR